jgi:hypothetical protein
MMFSPPQRFGPRRRSAFDSFSKVVATLSLRSEGAVNSTMAIGRSRANMDGQKTANPGVNLKQIYKSFEIEINRKKANGEWQADIRLAPS